MKTKHAILKKISEIEKSLDELKLLINDSDDESLDDDFNGYELAVKGIPKNLAGYNCIQECLKYMKKCYEDDPYRKIFFYEVAQEVSKKMGKTVQYVENSIRYAIKYSWDHKTEATSYFSERPKVSFFLMWWIEKC